MTLVPFSRISNLRSLIIDDMPSMRQNIRMHLGQLGITKVDQAATPDEAIRFVQAASHDLIICDYNLNKETNGQQLLEFSVRNGCCRRPPCSSWSPPKAVTTWLPALPNFSPMHICSSR